MRKAKAGDGVTQLVRRRVWGWRRRGRRENSLQLLVASADYRLRVMFVWMQSSRMQQVDGGACRVVDQVSSDQTEEWLLSLLSSLSIASSFLLYKTSRPINPATGNNAICVSELLRTARTCRVVQGI